jgi:nucleotide-binding universal stress UspA family protein
MRRILVAVDGTEASHEAASTALEYAEHLCMQVTFVHVLPPRVAGQEGDAPEFAAFEAACEQYAAQLLRKACFARGSRSWRADTRVVHGETVSTLCELAQEPDVDLVIIGTRPRGPWARTLLGSVSGQLLSQCTKPVLVVPERATHAAAQPERTDAQTQR